MTRHEMPEQFTKGDQITFRGSIAFRGRRHWSWGDDGLLARLLFPIDDRSMRELLRDEHPHAYVSKLGERSES